MARKEKQQTKAQRREQRKSAPPESQFATVEEITGEPIPQPEPEPEEEKP